MKNNNEYIKGFYHLKEAWYGKYSLTEDILDEIILGYYYPEDGTTGEFSIKWERLDGRNIPKIIAYDDSWNVLYEFKDVLEELSVIDNTNPTPDQICELLLSLGFKDLTKRESPYHHDQKEKCPLCHREF